MIRTVARRTMVAARPALDCTQVMVDVTTMMMMLFFVLAWPAEPEVAAADIVRN